jgi:hypothetical protein
MTIIRATAYNHHRNAVSKRLKSGKSRCEDLALRTILLASMNNGYVEGSAMLTGISGQTVRNHIRDKNPDGLLQINQDLIGTMREKGLFEKPLIVAIDWHDEMYYGDHDAEEIIGTKNSRGSNHAYEYATASVVMKGTRFAIAVIPVKNRHY